MISCLISYSFTITDATQKESKTTITTNNKLSKRRNTKRLWIALTDHPEPNVRVKVGLCASTLCRAPKGYYSCLTKRGYAI